MNEFEVGDLVQLTGTSWKEYGRRREGYVVPYDEEYNRIVLIIGTKREILSGDEADINPTFITTIGKEETVLSEPMESHDYTATLIQKAVK